MLDYIKGLIFMPLFIYLIFSFGKKIKKSTFFSENLIYGFVFYTCFQFAGGFIAQSFNLSWIIYKTYMIILIIIIAFFSFYKNIHFEKAEILGHLKKYWLLYAMAFIFVCLSCLNLQYQWNANLADDGYYLQKIRMAPYVSNYADYNYAAGFTAPESIVRNLNTFEIEAAFYADVLGMDASVYAKIFLSFFNYTLILNVIYWFYRTVLKQSELKKIMIAIIPVLFFGIYQELLTNYNVLYLQDSWQFNTAIWYGSSLVRCIGLFLLITPLLQDYNITRNKIIFFTCSSICLFSKASQTLPIVFLVTLVYFIFFTFTKIKDKRKLFIFYILIIALMMIFPVSNDLTIRNSVIIDQFGKNSSTFIIKLSYLILSVSFLFGNKLIRKWNCWLIMIGLFMIVPRVNTVFLIISVYDFVAARTLTLYFFTLIITAFMYGYILLVKVITNKKEIIILYSGISIVLIAVPLISVERNLGLVNTVNVLRETPTLQPKSTLQLGEALTSLSEVEKKQLDVLMPMWVVLDGTPHPVATMLRYNATNIHSIGTIPRYQSLFEDNPYYSYTQDVHVNFERVNSGEDYNKKTMQSILDTYPNINCIVVYFEDAKERMERDFGFHVKDKIILEDNVHFYYIMMQD